MKEGDLIKLTKVSDDKFKGHHPNEINEGFSIIGKLVDNVTVGKVLLMLTPNDKRYRYFHTSIITEITGADEFKTLNSTYKVEVLEKAKPKDV